MTFIATTTIKIATGETRDDHDDPVANPSPAEDAKSWPVSIIEKRKQVIDPTTGDMRTVRYAIGRISPKAEVHDGDRLHDDRSSKVWVVDEITPNPRTFSGFGEVRLDLRIVSGE